MTCAQVIIGSPDLKANHNITQIVQLVADQEKYSKLIRLMGKEMDGRRILIFAETKRGCDDVSVMWLWVELVACGGDGWQADPEICRDQAWPR